jgi:hypothetical protein
MEISSAFVVNNPTPLRREARSLFFAFPTGEQVQDTWIRLFGEDTAPADARQDFTPETYAAIRNTWRDPRVQARLAIVYAEIFKENYARVIDMLAEEGE